MTSHKMWWDRKYGKGKICGITYCRLRPGNNKGGESYVVFLKCKHGFYRSALKYWVLTNLDRDPTCPFCRKPFHPLCPFI